MLHIVRWDSAARKVERVDPADLPATHADVGGQSVYWIDLDDPTPAEEERVFKRFHAVHLLTLEDVTKPRRDPADGAHFPKVEEFPDYLFVIVNPLPAEMRRRARLPLAPGGEGLGVRGTGSQVAGATLPLTPSPSPPAGEGGQTRARRTRPQLSAVLTENVLITHHYAPLGCISDGQAFLARHADGLGRGPDYVFHLILDGIVDEYAPVVERITERLDRLETKLFTAPSAELLARLLKVKRSVSYLRKTLILEREVLARLTRGEFRLVDAREIAYYRNVYDHLARYTELIESAREMVSDLMQTHLSASSNKLNEVMKALTMISTVGLVCGLIAGIYGMNFDVMPELRWAAGYPFALGVMAVAATAAVLFFKSKRWI